MRKASIVFGVLFLSIVANAQEIAIARAASQIDTTIPWITDAFAAGDPGRPEPALPTADRAKLLDQALEKAAAEKKLVFWYIPRIEGVQIYRPALLDDYMRATAFTSPMLANLIATRFVPLRMALPRTLFDRTGIKRVDWIEPAIAILDKGGKIVYRLDRIRTFNAEFFRSTLLAVLKENEAESPVPEAVVAACDQATRDPGEMFRATRNAAWAGYDAGALKVAEHLIQNGPTDILKAHGHFLKAAMLRLRRDAAGTKAALDAAVKLAGDDAELKGLITTERALLALRTGDVAAAQALFKEALGLNDNPRRAEAMYHAAVVRTLGPAGRGGPPAEATFRKLVAEFPESPYAAMAALNVMIARDTTPAGPVMHAFEDPFWPPEEVFGELRSNTAWPRPSEQSQDAIRRAITFLLRHQSDNGGFLDARYAYWPTPRILPNTWMAITAISLAGLSDWRELAPEEIDQAIKRGERYLFNAGNMTPGQNEEVYADAFRLLYLKRRLGQLPAGSKDAALARERLNTISKALADQQSETGFFAHEYPNPFTTGAALIALRQAQELGAAVPQGVFEAGAKGLRSVRGPEGSFTYGEGRAPGRDGEETLKNAMARMPLAERALLFAGDPTDTKALEAALDNFEKFLPRLERVRACDFHTDGELAGFFFWHGMYFTSEALKALPPEKRAAHMKKIADHVMSIGEIDGSFIDSHEMGKCYGSGMALMTLRNALEQKP